MRYIVIISRRETLDYSFLQYYTLKYVTLTGNSITPSVLDRSIHIHNEILYGENAKYTYYNEMCVAKRYYPYQLSARVIVLKLQFGFVLL